MHTSRYAIAGLALVASTIIVSCGDDDNSTPSDSGVISSALDSIPGVGDTTSGGANDTTLTTDSLAGSSSNSSVVGTTLP
ncbi:MAG TPA: hypothetical protein VIH06_00565 [Ilumatobacteraceae bacterium]|jgi:hypothetical protein